MALLQDFSSQTGSFDAAILAATISILLGGILFGVGLGFGLRRMRLFGAEEIGQGIISAAMAGAIFSFALLADATVSSMVPHGAVPSCPGIASPTGSPFSYYSCNLQSLSDSLRSLCSSLSRSADITGFASSLSINAGVISAQPFFALQSASKQLSDASAQSGFLSALSFLELSLAGAIQSSALQIFLPAGLLLRTFFATRRLGSAAMALSISAYLIFPLLFLYTFTVSSAGAAISDAAGSASSFNSQFASLPLLDLDATGTTRQQINSMSQNDFGGAVQPIFPLALRANALALEDLLVYPLISLLVSAVAALEFYSLISAPIFIPYFESI